MSVLGTRRLAVATVALGLMVGAAWPVNAGSNKTSALYKIPLSSGTIDPLMDLSQSDPRDRDLVLVQFKDFGDSAVIHKVAATGAKMVQPLAPVSYLVWADASQTQAIRKISGVRFAGTFPAANRIADSVTPATTQLRVTLLGSFKSRLGDVSVRPRAFTQMAGAVVEIAGGLDVARTLARLPRVYSIADAGGAPQLREERTDSIISVGSVPATPDYRGFLDQYGADGTGVIIAHVDGGVDFNHPELSDRIAGCIDYTIGAACDAGNTDDAVGHGTHTLGIILGNGSTGLGDTPGFDYGLGVAPGAKAVVLNAINAAWLEDPFGDGYAKPYLDAYNLGAIVSANSWGPASTPKGYDQDTRDFDVMVRDLDPTAAGDQSIGHVFSVMNGNGGTSTQGTPDEAKNIIGVGGTKGRGGSIDDLCTCSAHGPTLDGRFLPTIVAPGQSVVSTRAAQGTLCGLPFASAGENPPSPLHAGCTGTSMASPHVSGAYAVFVDYYRDHFDGATPSPALVKAALVNGAKDLKGAKDADGIVMTAIPNNKQGWGRLHLGNVFSAWEAGTVHIDQTEIFTSAADSYSVTVEPIDPTKPLKATLTWTDAPGPGLGGPSPSWINDLDLRVTSATGSWWGNVFSNGLSTAGGQADRRNNLENVFIATPGGTNTITVDAANIIGNGLPNSGGITDQDFALVITNARIVSS